MDPKAMPTTEERVEQHLAIVTQQTREILAPALAARSAEALHRALAQLFAYDEQTKAALVTALARDPRCLPVCAPGCAFCCHLSVFASVPELLALAEHLRRTLPEDALAAVTARVNEAAGACVDESQALRAQAKRPCPLLDRASGRCGVYEARPFACRAYNSCDAGVCERAFDEAKVRWDVPIDLFQLTVSRNVRTGLLAATHAAGLDPGPYELAAGLAVALTVPDAEARWLASDPIFAAAETRIGRERRAAWREAFTRAADAVDS